MRKLEKIAPYLWEARFEDYTQDETLATLPEGASFSCSAARRGALLGRNFDFDFNDIPEFVVHMAAKEGRLASLGVSMHCGLRDVGEPWSDEEIAMIPNITLDGINEAGVTALVNVVPRGDCGEVTGTAPGRESLHPAFVVRYILDHAVSALHAVSLLRERNICGRYSPYFDVHWLVGDAENSFAVEIIENRLVAKPHRVMTNFNLCRDDRKAEEYYLPEPGKTNIYTPYAKGIERYIYLRDHLSEAGTQDELRLLMSRVRYSKMYDRERVPFMYSDWLSSTQGHSLDFVLGRPAEKEAAIEAECQRVNAILSLPAEERQRYPAPDCCITVHTSVYDIEKRSLLLSYQEVYEKTYKFTL